MSTDVTRPSPASLPLAGIAEACRRWGVARLWVCETAEHSASEFLVEFRDGDAGPWGGKLDDLQNDLAGLLHRPVPVHSRLGVDHSASARDRATLLANARLIYGS
jgi:hypothetical protein